MAHPDLAAEQAYIDHAYDCLERARAGGHPAAVDGRGRQGRHRAGPLGAGDDRGATSPQRLAYLQPRRRQPGVRAHRPGPVRGRRHASTSAASPWPTSTRSRSSSTGGRRWPSRSTGPPAASRWAWSAAATSPPAAASCSASRTSCSARRAGLLGGELAVVDDGREIRGHGALIAALEEARTGRLSDIVATIQGEQDEIIRCRAARRARRAGRPRHRQDGRRAPPGRLPALHPPLPARGPGRARRRPQPAVPRLHRAGAAVARRGRVELAVLADLLDARRAVEGRDRPATARVKGDLRMAKVLAKAVRDRERPLRRTLRVRLRPADAASSPAERTAAIVADARRRFRLAQRRPPLRRGAAVRGARRQQPRCRPTPERGARAPPPRARGPRGARADVAGAHPGRAAPRPVRLARRSSTWPAGPLLDRRRAGRAAPRPRPTTSTSVVWTVRRRAAARRGPRAARAQAPAAQRNGSRADDEVRTYGHIVVDEAQDLSPMQLRMLDRRSLNGSMTVVGDIAQATGAWAHADWDEILEHLPDKRPARRAELTIGYRIPGPTWRWPPRCCAVAAPDLQPPDSVRQEGDAPRIVAVDPGRARRPGGARSRPRSATRSTPAAWRSSPRDSLVDEVAAGARRGRHRVRPGRPQRPRQPGHPRAGQPGQGPRARRRRGGRAGGHRRRGGAGPPGPLRRAHPGHQAARDRPRPPPPRAAPLTAGFPRQDSGVRAQREPLRRRGGRRGPQRPRGRRLPGPGRGYRCASSSEPTTWAVPRSAAGSSQASTPASRATRTWSACCPTASCADLGLGSASHPDRSHRSRRCAGSGGRTWACSSSASGPGDGRVVPRAHRIRRGVRGVAATSTLTWPAWPRRWRPPCSSRCRRWTSCVDVSAMSAWDRLVDRPAGRDDRGHLRATTRCAASCSPTLSSGRSPRRMIRPSGRTAASSTT